MTLLGHEQAWRQWRTAMLSERMHHAWLLVGPRGLGKGSFARAAAAALVHEGAGIAMGEGAHPDILLLDHLPDGEEEARKRDEGKPHKLKRNISIDQIRRMQARLTTRPTLGDKRAIVVDPADAMEGPAANALLKSLEEPPQGSTFLLVAHSPARLPPTIRSRCRIVRFAPLDDNEVDGLLRREAPEAAIEAREAAILAARGAPGAALAFVARELTALSVLIRRIASAGDPDFVLRTALAKEIGARPDRERMTAFFDLVQTTLNDALADADRDAQGRIIEVHANISVLAAQAPTYNFDPALLVAEIGGLLASVAMPRQSKGRA